MTYRGCYLKDNTTEMIHGIFRELYRIKTRNFVLLKD